MFHNKGTSVVAFAVGDRRSDPKSSTLSYNELPGIKRKADVETFGQIR